MRSSVIGAEEPRGSEWGFNAYFTIEQAVKIESEIRKAITDVQGGE